MKLRKFWKNKSTAPSYESTASYDAILGLKAGHAPKRSRAVPKSSKNAVQRLGHHKHDGEFFSYDSTTPTTWSWSLSKIKSSRPKRRLKPRVSGNLRKNLGDATWLNRDVRLKFQQEEQLRNSLVSKKHFIRPEDNPNSRIRATRNIASAGPHRVVEPHTIQAIKGSNVIAQTSNLPSIPIMQGQSSLGAVRGINVRETVIRQREIHPGAHREALVRQLARLRSAIHGVHYGTKNFYRKLFAKSDLNHDEKLSFAEFHRFVRLHFLLNEVDCKIVFDAIDSRNSGYISYEEFLNFLRVEES